MKTSRSHEMLISRIKPKKPLLPRLLGSMGQDSSDRSWRPHGVGQGAQTPDFLPSSFTLPLCDPGRATYPLWFCFFIHKAGQSPFPCRVAWRPNTLPASVIGSDFAGSMEGEGVDVNERWGWSRIPVYKTPACSFWCVANGSLCEGHSRIRAHCS